MNAPRRPTPTSGPILAMLRKYPARWIAPTLVVGAITAVYAFVRPATWEASQALILRNDAASGQAGPGKFGQGDEMKTVQETILELAKSRGVPAAALKRVGPPSDDRGSRERWPTPADVAALQDAMKLSPPKGAEFGSTEVFYLKVQDGSRERAVDLAAAVAAELERSYQSLRNTRAQSMTDELQKAARLAQRDLADSTARLKALESGVGSDLAELRLLTEPGSGESALRRTLTEIRGEMRQARSHEQSLQELLVQLNAARRDTKRLAALPAPLLESQPSLKRLKDGLVDAQLRTAELEGRMSARHPLVLAARESEAEIRRNLHAELDAAVRGLQAELRLSSDRVILLEQQLASADGKLDRLATERAEYANLAAETRNRGQLLERAEQRLAEVRATQATATAASLLSPIDLPDAGIRPIGPGRSLLILMGLAGGLMAGLGVLLLTAQPDWPQPAIEPVGLSLIPLPPRNGHVSRHALSLSQALRKIDHYRGMC